MTAELVVGPRDKGVQAELTKAHGWNAYLAGLRGVLGVVIEASGVDTLEVSELPVSQPLPDRYRMLRNGKEAGPAEAKDLIEGMAAGYGPYCWLSRTERLRVESGWDGAAHLYMTPETSGDLVELRSRNMSGVRVPGGTGYGLFIFPG